MAKRAGALGGKRKKGPHKTKKRLAIKRARLATQALKRGFSKPR